MKYLAFLLVAIKLVSCLDGDTFTLNCAPLTFQRSDPIVNPGIASTHVHAVIGGNNFKRTMGPNDAKMGNMTTCNKGLDKSNYWVPQLYHQNADKMWEMVTYSGSAVYYQKRACDYEAGRKVCDKAFVPLAFPDGFRMVAGDPARRTQNSTDFAQKAIAIMCLPANKEAPGFPTVHCDQFRSEIYFPSCWDGKNLDTPNHHDHVAYPAIGDYNGGVCPQSHPVAIFSIFYEFYFETGKYPDINRFAWANGDPTGYGLHGDFVMGWEDRGKLQTAHRDCITSADCPTLQNQAANRVPLINPAIYEEQIGLNGPIASLPGNNPVQWPTNRIMHQ